MWDAIKTICGLIVVIGLVLAVVSTFFIFSWVLKILAIIVAMVIVAFLFVYVIWELLRGWWQDR